jgi:putative Holliday junction resolvase
MRYVAIDLGDKRTGIAVGDLVTGIASPVDVIECPIDRAGGEELVATVARVVADLLGPSRGGSSGSSEGEGGLVLGLPLNMDGTEGQRAKIARAWGERIAQRTGWPVEFVDERLSSVAADEKMARSGLTHKQKKARRDAIAAAAILRTFLESRGRENRDRQDESD